MWCISSLCWGNVIKMSKYNKAAQTMALYKVTCWLVCTELLLGTKMTRRQQNKYNLKNTLKYHLINLKFKINIIHLIFQSSWFRTQTEVSQLIPTAGAQHPVFHHKQSCVNLNSRFNNPCRSASSAASPPRVSLFPWRRWLPPTWPFILPLIIHIIIAIT